MAVIVFMTINRTGRGELQKCNRVYLYLCKLLICKDYFKLGSSPSSGLGRIDGCRMW